MLKVIFFGLDGLICNLVDINFYCWTKTLEPHGYGKLKFSEYVDFFEGPKRSWVSALGSILPFSTQNERKKIRDQKEDLFCDLLDVSQEFELVIHNQFQVERKKKNRIKLHVPDGMTYFLENLPVEKEYTKVCFSRLSKKELSTCLKSLGIEKFIDVQLNLQPDSKNFLQSFLRDQKIAPKNCVLFAGKREGIQQGTQNGILSLGMKHVLLINYPEKNTVFGVESEKITDDEKKKISEYHTKWWKVCTLELMKAGCKTVMNDFNTMKIIFLEKILKNNEK